MKRKFVKPLFPPLKEPTKIPPAASITISDPCGASHSIKEALIKKAILPQNLIDRIGLPTIAVGFDIEPWPYPTQVIAGACAISEQMVEP